MHSHVYLDESGDLGFKFNRKYREGGSSRFLTLGFLVCPASECHLPKRIVKDVYSKFGFKLSKEKKGASLTKEQRQFVATETVKMLAKKPDFQLGAITVMKEKTKPGIQLDPNVLYNYMMRISILQKIDTHVACKLTRDNRSVKVASGNSCIDYLKTTLIFEHQSETILTDNPQHSHYDDGLIFIDWITNIVWSHYEDRDSDAYKILVPHLKNQQLFF